MPWKESSVMDDRMRSVIRLKDGEGMASLVNQNSGGSRCHLSTGCSMLRAKAL